MSAARRAQVARENLTDALRTLLDAARELHEASEAHALALDRYARASSEARTAGLPVMAVLTGALHG